MCLALLQCLCKCKDTHYILYTQKIFYFSHSPNPQIAEVYKPSSPVATTLTPVRGNFTLPKKSTAHYYRFVGDHDHGLIPTAQQ